MKKVLRLPLTYALAAVAVWALVVGAGSVSQTTSTAQDNSSPGVVDPAAQNVGAAGYVVHIDPETGGITESPQHAVPLVLDQALQNALDTSSEDLVEVPSPVAGGGVVVDLQGRFQNTMIVTVDSSDRLQSSCVSGVNGDSKTEDEKETDAYADEEGGERR